MFRVQNAIQRRYIQRLLSMVALVALLGLSTMSGAKAQGGCPYPYDVCEIILRSTDVELKKEGDNVRGSAQAPFTKPGDGVINTVLDVNSADLLSWQLGGSKIKIKNLETGQFVDPSPVEYCSTRGFPGFPPLPGYECNRKYNAFNILANTRYAAELEVDYGVLVLPIKDFRLTATVSGKTLDSANVVLRKVGDNVRGVTRVQFTPDTDGNIEWRLEATGRQNFSDWAENVIQGLGLAASWLKAPWLSFISGVLQVMNGIEENGPYQLGGSKLLITNLSTGDAVLSREFCKDRGLPTPGDDCNAKSGQVFVYKDIPYEAELQVDYGALIYLIRDHVLTATFSGMMVEVDPRDDIWEDATYYDLPIYGNLEFSGDQDWQRINVPAGGTTLILDVPDGKNYDLELWRDDVKSQVAISANGTGTDEHILINDPGYYRIHIFGADPTSDFDALYRVLLTDDDIAPSSTIVLSGTQGDNGWYRSNVQVALNATDNPGGLGIQTTEYGFNYTPWNPFMGPWNVYENPFVINTEGHNYLEFRSTDKAGNVESNQSRLIMIDKTPPNIVPHPIPSPNSNGWYNTDVEVGFEASDFQSGIASLTPASYTFINEGADQSVTGTAIDNAGNSATFTIGNINIDRTPPTITIITPEGKDYLHSASFDMAWSASDSLSGIATSSATLDGQPVINGQTIDLFFLSLGSHTVALQADDLADNGAGMSMTFNVVADIDSLLAVTQRAYDMGWIEKQGVYTSLDAKLKAAQTAIDHNQFGAARKQLLAFINKLETQKGKSINQQAYDLLKADALYVMEHLP